MDILMDFLESSTIHGLSHISLSKTPLAKLSWVAIVILGFCLAGYLINNSYSEWQEKPVATSLSTHPISSLPSFPSVTVCPPHGSNTALNYDLMRAGEDTLNTTLRNYLKQFVKETFLKDTLRYSLCTSPTSPCVDQSVTEFIKTMEAFTNPGNLADVYHGYQKYPALYNGFDMTSSSLSGRLSTPWLGEELQEEYYSRDRSYHYSLQFPDNLNQLVGNGSLEIRLEMDMAEGWQEQAHFGVASGGQNGGFRGPVQITV